MGFGMTARNLHYVKLGVEPGVTTRHQRDSHQLYQLIQLEPARQRERSGAASGRGSGTKTAATAHGPGIRHGYQQQLRMALE
jgi:hypothetical protein